MTRSIGDFDLKKMGVTAEPETKRVSVGEASPRVIQTVELMISSLMNLSLVLNMAFSAAAPRPRLLPGVNHRRHQLHYEQPGDLQRHQPEPRPQGGGPEDI